MESLIIGSFPIPLSSRSFPVAAELSSLTTGGNGWRGDNFKTCHFPSPPPQNNILTAATIVKTTTHRNPSPYRRKHLTTSSSSLYCITAAIPPSISSILQRRSGVLFGIGHSVEDGITFNTANYLCLGLPFCH
ncbi:hypothetical protein F0562_011657 [Nyssa sinensis]|uniref:Uncharacterized protein n=1 Tax=Nyssa sinensis TaxID=561372 RepID=A0A5J4ZT17_9ASTE|nr:hypothetical protein F0562_011657 [Nyssa sinensis]